MTVDLESEHQLWIDYACTFCNLCKSLISVARTILPWQWQWQLAPNHWIHETTRVHMRAWGQPGHGGIWGHMRASIRAFEGTWRPHTASWVLFWQEPHTLAMDCGWPMWFEQFSTSAPLTRDGCNSIKRTIKIEFLRCPAVRIFLWVGWTRQ